MIMKKKTTVTILLIMSLTVSMLASACGKKPETLEDYAKENSEISDRIAETTESSDVKISISGNDIIYTYDLAAIDGYSEEVVKNDAAVEALGDALDRSGDNFVKICGSVQDATGLSGIRVVVNYNFKDEAVVTRTFTSEGAAEEEKKPESAGSEKDSSEEAAEGGSGGGF